MVMKSKISTVGAPHFGAVMDEWLGTVRTYVKPTTFAAYDTIVRSHLEPEFGDLKPSKLGAAQIEAYRRELMEDDYAPTTLKNIMNVLRGAVHYAQRYGCTVGDEVFKGNSVNFTKDIQVLSTEDQEKIVEFLGEHPRGKSLGVLICMYTGLRVGEVCGLRWGDISKDGRSLTVKRTVSRMRCGGRTELYVGEPKSTSSRRRIPLPANIAQILSGPGRRPDDYYIVTNSPIKIPEPRNMQRYFHEVQESVGIEVVKFHALRHTFATRCVELGFDVKSLSMILGHANVSVTLNTYVHPSFERLKSMMDLLDQ